MSTAVTIANQPQLLIGVSPGGQGAAPAPFLEDVRLNFLPGNQSARLVLQFEDVAGLETKLFAKLARNFDLAVLRQNCVHGSKVRVGES